MLPKFINNLSITFKPTKPIRTTTTTTTTTAAAAAATTTKTKAIAATTKRTVAAAAAAKTEAASSPSSSSSSLITAATITATTTPTRISIILRERTTTTTTTSTLTSTSTTTKAAIAATAEATEATAAAGTTTTKRWQNFYTTELRKFLLFILIIAITITILEPMSCQAERDFNFNDSQIPLIEPKDEPTFLKGIQDPYAVELSQCHLGDNEIVLSLILKDYNWHDLSEARKAKALAKLSTFFAISKNYITMESVTKRELYEMQKHSLKRGTNKCHMKKNHRKLGRVNFIIGCGTSYFSIGEPIAKQIGQQMKDGSLDNIIEEEFGWWIIWRKPYKPMRPLRQRRQIEGSGDDDDDYNDDNYDYDDDEDDDNVEDTATEIPTTTTQHIHRHHHGSVISSQEDLDDINTSPIHISQEESNKITFITTPQGDIENNLSSTSVESFSTPSSSSSSVSSATASASASAAASSSPSSGTILSSSPSVTSSTQETNLLTTPNAAITTVSSMPAATTTANIIPVTPITPTTLTTTLSSTATTTKTTTTTMATTPAALIPSSTTLSTIVIPDYIESKFENTPPIIKMRLQKLAVTSGKTFKFRIPSDTFYDHEDASNLHLAITDQDGHELKTNSWLQFNADTKEIYGLPLDDAVSKWQYRLTATDSGNESVTEMIEISVQQHRGVRSVNHEINIAVKINEKNITYIDWQLKLINAIAITMGDSNTNSIVVREIRQTAHDPHAATLIYFNETLPTAVCPETQLNTLVKHLDAHRLSDLVYPMLGIKSITGQLIGPCQKVLTHKPKVPSTPMKNSPPIPRNQVDRVVATTGHLLVYKVPSDTFFDANDNVLTLTLKTKNNKELNPRHWLQFDTKNQEFYGIPKGGDIGSEEYLLIAEDSGGLTAADALVVQVNHAPKREFLVYFKVYLAVRHEQFNADLQRKFVERIAQLFGDDSPQHIQIRSVTTYHDADGTIVNFYNTTMYKMHNRCPEEEIEAIRNVYLDGHTVRERVRKILGPELNITNVQVTTLGVCNPQTEVTHREFIPNRTEEPLLKSTFSDDYMFTIILPAIIIVSMILIAALVACCLHRRRRKSGKMELGDEEERKSFKTKGIPVIFQDELDEKPEIGNKSPIILKDEKPPLLPPSYNTSTTINGDDVDEYVPPPAVMMAGGGGSSGRESRGKSPVTPSYRKPPPYVSP